MITFDDFITKYTGKFIDFDGVLGYQCMDLMHQFCKEVLGITDGSVLAAPSAAQVYTNFNNVTGNNLFYKIDNTPDGIPVKGDIFFWSFNHVAIVHDANINNLNSFDQNYPTGSACHIQFHTYDGALGWLRFKGLPTTDWQAQYNSELDKYNKLAERMRQVRDIANGAGV